jgi:heme-degrading monooxygenase HmoA
MIARIWRGAVRPDDGDVYVAYIERTGIREYRETPGNISAHMLRRDLADRTEIITLSFWESMEAIRAFAGDDPEVAVYYPEDDRFLIDRPAGVEHYEVPVSDPPLTILPASRPASQEQS